MFQKTSQPMHYNLEVLIILSQNKFNKYTVYLLKYNLIFVQFSLLYNNILFKYV